MDNLNDFNYDQIKDWLAAALKRERALPLVTSDEPAHLGIARLESQLEPHTRRSIDTACYELVRSFCETATGEPAYLTQLILLSGKLKNRQITSLLAELAINARDFPALEMRVLHLVLATLADVSPPQSAKFWESIQARDKARFSGVAFAGMLKIDPFRAIDMLPSMPPNPGLGGTAALNIDLCWDSLPPSSRPSFVEKIRQTLARCSPEFSAPIAKWALSKFKFALTPEAMRQRLEGALKITLGAKEAIPRRLTPKLIVPQLEAA